MRRLLIVVTMSALAMPSQADTSSIRELDAYCVDVDGSRVGVAASQDGATLAYTQAPLGAVVMVRTIHNRRSVSGWHASLDAAGFETMDLPAAARPFCALERTMNGAFHRLAWPEGDAPPAVADLFHSIMALHRDAPV